jgi:hypothetical protein
MKVEYWGKEDMKGIKEIIFSIYYDGPYTKLNTAECIVSVSSLSQF